jgi:Flp pilus assembly protein TadB
MKRIIKDPKKKKPKKERHKLKHFLFTAGMYTEPKVISIWILICSIVLGIVLDIYLTFYWHNLGFNIFQIILYFLLGLPFIIGFFYIAVWLVFLFYLDMAKFQRQQKIEEVFPDFLQLTAANIRSGMPIDQALWFAIRPRFGILAAEMEQVAKEVMSGHELKDSLKKFSEKYDSLVVQRSFSLLLVGMEAGGEIGELLNKISVDIQESRIMRKEMVANVQTYVIFISFTTIAAAPLLMGLALQLLIIVQGLMSNMSFDPNVTGSMGIGISPGGGSVAVGDFKVFAYTMLSITSFVSSMIIAIIKSGSVKAGLKFIPMFIIASIILFTISAWAFGKLFSGIVI